MDNLLINGAFDIWERRSGQALGGVAALCAPRWLVGPGVGGSVDWSIEDFDGPTCIPVTPRHFLRLKWTVGPTAGEKPGSGRFTFLENHGIRDARQLAGCWVDVTWWVRLAAGVIAVIPIAWSNYVNGDYLIHDGEAFPVRASRGWMPLTQTLWIPPVPAGKQISVDSYVGFGLDFLTLYGPTLDIACVEVRRKQVALIDPQLERVRALGQFWN